MLFVCIVLLPLTSRAYSGGRLTGLPEDTTKNKAKEVQSQEDAMDIVKKVLKIKRNKQAEDSANLRPGVVYPAIFPAVGYSVTNGGTATIAANLSFYTDSINKTNLSTVLALPLVSTMRQFICPVISNIWLKDNKINLLGDWRYYKYPSYTYGLGGYNTVADQDQIDYSYVKIDQEVLFEMGKNLYGGFGYNLDYHFNIQNLDDATDLTISGYPLGAPQTISSGVIAHIKYDSRTNINNPKDAFFGSVIYRYNSTMLGSTSNWQSLQIELRKYIKLKSNPDDVLAFWSWNEFTSGAFGGTQVPYFDLPSTGWDTYANTGRGYIQSRYRGTSLAYLETEFRFGITRNGLLGGVVFVNGESVPEWPSNKFETIDFGEGVGLRIKLNRYSDTNFCIDYAWGNGGSQGFFFNLGEVF